MPKQKSKPAATPDPIDDAAKLIKNARNTIDNLISYQSYILYSMKGASKEKIALLNNNINILINSAESSIIRAKATLEFAQSQLKNTDTHDPNQRLINKKLFEVQMQASRLKNLQERILSRMVALKTDPLLETIKEMPKSPNVDPNTSLKIDNLVAGVFGEFGIVKDKSIPAIIKTLNTEEKNMFFKQLAKVVLQNEHCQLNNVKIFEQLPFEPVSKDRGLFINELINADKIRSLEILQNTKVPDVKLNLPKRKAEVINTATPINDDMKDEYQKQVTEGARIMEENIKDLPKGTAIIRKMLDKIPDDKRLQFIKDVKEEVAHRNLEKKFAELPPIPKNLP